MVTNPAPSDTAPALVGRTAELQELVATLDEAAAGRGGVVLLAGEPGIGKTRLASECAQYAARRGARVLWGRCYEGAGAPPFWPWSQLVQAALVRDEGGPLQPAFGAGAAELGQLLPTLRTPPADQPPLAPQSPEEARFRLFEAVRDLLSAASSTQPHVLVLDDLHWADTPSLLLLQFLARELTAMPLLMVGTYRDGEIARGRPLAQTLAALARVEGARLIHLVGLSAAAVGDYLAGLFDAPPPPALVAEITDRSGGNPFFVGELARLLVATTHPDGRPAAHPQAAALPAGARAVLDQWLESCSADCLTVLNAAAVVGRDFGLDLLTRTMGLVADAVLDALDEAEAARIVAPVPGIAGGYAFVHALLREHLYAQLSGARRLRLHGQVCTALERVYRADDAAQLADLAHHAFEAAPLGDVARAVRYARRAGDQAMAQLAYEEAVRYYSRALEALALAPSVDHHERGTLLLALGDAQNATGDATAAEATFAEAAAAGRAGGAAAVLARAALGFGGERLAEAGADWPRIALLEEALAALGAEAGDETPALRVRVLIGLSETLRAPRDLARRWALSEEAVAVARQLADPRLLGAALSARCGARWGPDEMTAVVSDARELLALADGAGEPSLALQARHWLILELLARGELHAADMEIERFAGLATEVRDPIARWQAAALRVVHPQLRGRFAEAEVLAAEARALGERVNRANARATFDHQVSTGRVLREGWAGAIPGLEAAESHFPAFPGWRAALALAYADAGRTDDARRELERLAVHDFADLPRGPRWLHILALLAHTCALLGDRRRALLLYALLEPLAGSTVFATDGLIWQGATDYYLGMLATTLGRWEAAARHFDAALALYADNDVPVWMARAQQAYAEMLVARGAPGDEEHARELLAEVLATGHRLRLSAVVTPIQAMRPRAAERLHSAPAPPAALPDGLTAREAEVLRLIAGGRSNAQIAAALVLSVRTVERHIMNLYPKIGAHNRAEAAAYAIHHDLV